MSVLQGAVLGLIQGIGEFLPVSSSAHLFLARLLLGIGNENAAFRVLDILLHVGTLIPILLVFWRDWIDMIAHPVRNKTLLKLFLASLPTLAFYVLLDYDVFDSGWLMGACFLVTAVLLLLTDRLERRPGTAEPTIPQALCMGVMQGLGMVPGISRLGSTTFGGVAAGVGKKGAVKFSFMMSAPAVVASLLVEGKHALEEDLFSHLEIAPCAVGVLVAAVVGFFAIHLMLKLVEKVPLSWLALYMALLGLAYLFCQLMGLGPVPPFAAPEQAQILRFLQP